MPIVIPSILSDSVRDIQQKLDRLKAETTLTRVQIDITDPDFVHELTVTPIDLLDLETHGMAIDIHLMTNDPINDVIECSQVPGINTVIAQIEHMSSQADFVEHVKSFNLKVGLSLDYTTSAESLEVYLLGELDSLQVVDVQEGAQSRDFGGEVALQALIEIAELIKTSKRLDLECLADGGINVETAKQCLVAGASGLVVGSFLWQSSDLAAAVHKLV